MSEHAVTLAWNLGQNPFTYQGYSRDHSWTFENGVQIQATAAPAYRGNPELINPEDAFVASIASCHMLTFLALAQKKGFTVERYEDRAVGTLEKNAHGSMAITKVILHPAITFGGASSPAPSDLNELHEQAHHHCFIANSVTTVITVEPKD